MKRILSLAAVFLLAVTMLSFNAFATKEKLPEADTSKKIIVSDDYKTVYYNNETYLYYSNFENRENSEYAKRNSFELTEAQDKDIEDIYAYIAPKSIEIVYSFHKGGYWTAVYIKEDLFQKYANIDYIKSENCIISLDTVKTFTQSAEKLKNGKAVKFKPYEIYKYARYYAVGEESGIDCGLILADAKTEEFYFICFTDFEEYNGTAPDLMQYDEVTAYKITDKKLLTEMQENYYGEEDIIRMENTEDTTIGMIICLLFSSLVFAGVPMAIMILSIVFISRKKTKTKKGYIITVALCGAELICFIYIFANIIMHM